VLRTTLLDVADTHASAIMPGYTHLQKAQPVLFAHHLLAYYWMFARDFERLERAAESANKSPLGSAALAGTDYPLDREATAAALGFDAVIPNSMDAVSDRDFALELAFAAAVAMMHLSRLSEEIVLWATNEFQFVTLDDAYSTGSSIMPQKKNADFAELTRGKTGRVYGDLLGLLTTMKGLPLAYNKDLQEDKEGVFDAIDTLHMALEAARGMLATMQVNEPTMRAAAEGGFMAATDLADYLVSRGVAFRDAHAVVGHLVLQAEKDGTTLPQLSREQLEAACKLVLGEGAPSFDDAQFAEAMSAVEIEHVVARRTTQGGTAPERVAEQMQLARERLFEDEKLL
jgi:argininosuccinate lyase